MSDTPVDDYEEYNYDQDKYQHAGHSGKQRSKKEAAEHTNQHDPTGHTRKILVKMENTQKNRKAHDGSPPKSSPPKSL